MRVHGVGDCVGGRGDGDQHLLIPQFCLQCFNLIVQLIRLVSQLQLLLAKVENQHG